MLTHTDIDSYRSLFNSLQYKPAISARLIAMLGTLLLAVACSPQGKHHPDDVVIIGQTAEPKSLDPHVATSLNDFRILVNIYEGLVRFREGTLEPEPALASAWDISDDGRRYTFHLREDVLFQDGTVFDAEAVKFNFERMCDQDHPFHHTGPFPLAFFFDKIENIEVADRYTVVFHLAEPFAPLLSNLAYPTGLMVSPAAVQRHDMNYGRQPTGTGPFRFVQWEARRRIVLERNPAYWGEPTRPGTLVFRPLTDPMTRVAELMAGGVDIVTELSPDNVALLRDSTRFVVHEQTGPHLWFVILNTREGPFRDKRVRQAVNYAIDKRALVEHVLQHTATEAAGPVPDAFGWASNDNIKPYPHDPEHARSLLQEAGYDNSVTVRLLAPTSGSGMLSPIQMATAIQGNLAEVGIDVHIETYEWNTFLAKVNRGLAGQGDMAEMAWMTNDPDTLPYLALRSEATPDQGGFNSGYYQSADADALIEQARTTTNRTERARLYRKLEYIVHEDAPWIFVASWRQNAVTTSRLKGFALQPSFFLLLRNAYKADT
jgi:peptide/nickel transport system substrate-binding protein